MKSENKLLLIAALGTVACLTSPLKCLSTQAGAVGVLLGSDFDSCVSECDREYTVTNDPTQTLHFKCITGCWDLYGYQLRKYLVPPIRLYTCVTTGFLSSNGSTYSGQSIPFGPILLPGDTNMSVKLAVTLYNGTNFVAASGATSVTCYAVPLATLSAYSPSNYDQAPWSNLGQGVYDNTNGYWDLSWTPTNNEQSYVINTFVNDPTIDTNNSEFVSNGVALFVNVAIPQPATPIFVESQLAVSNQFSTMMIAPVGSNYDVQASTDLKTWNTLTTFTNFVGEAQIVDPSTNAVRFYRTLMY